MKELLEKKLKEVDQLIMKAEKSSEYMPEGKLVLSQSNGVTQYYHKTDSTQKKGIYISNQNKNLIYSLAQKDYDLKFLKEAKEQRRRIGEAIKLLPDKELKDIYSKLPEARKALVSPHILPDAQYVKVWEGVTYKGKEISNDVPSIVTERGEKVRSKSEKILADKFLAMGIPYRYEYPVCLKGYRIVYPDFTLLNVRTREEVYFEHFGMMDNPEYSQKAIQKIETYSKNGIYIGKKLLVTFETYKKTVDMRAVEQMLKTFIQ